MKSEVKSGFKSIPFVMIPVKEREVSIKLSTLFTFVRKDKTSNVIFKLTKLSKYKEGEGCVSIPKGKVVLITRRCTHLACSKVVAASSKLPWDQYEIPSS